MEKEFSFSEVSKIRKYYKGLLKDIDNVFSIIEKKQDEVRFKFNFLRNIGYFSKVANFGIDGLEYKKDIDQFHDLLVAIDNNVRVEELSLDLELFNEEHSKRIKKYLNDLVAASNGLGWLFTSKKRKEELKEEYYFLNNLRNTSVVKDAEESIGYIKNLSKIDIKKVLEHYNEDKEAFRGCVLNANPNAFKEKTYIDKIKNILGKNEELINNIKIVKSYVSKAKQNIKTQIETLHSSQIYNLLKTIPVDELNRYKKGIKVKTLKDHGYNNMADIYSVNVFTLTAISGISKDLAREIKKVALDYASKATDNFKIKLSLDDQNKYSTNLVIAIATLRKLENFIKETIDGEAVERLQTSFEILKEVGNGAIWPFLTNLEKQDTIDAYNFLKEQLYSNYGKSISDATRYYASLNSVSSDEAWNDFALNSIQFFSIIEKLTPGLLGNNDNVYGLNEDLVKAVEEQQYSNNGLKCTLRRYQEYGVKYILHQERVLLGDEMGLGKTVQAIATLVALSNTGETHFVVVCPASVLTNWCREIAKHSYLNVIKVHGKDRKDAFKYWMLNGGVAVTTYEASGTFEFPDDKFKFSQIVVDEAHYIKNKDANRSKKVRELCEHAERVLFMSGTALENRVDEMIELIGVLRSDIANKLQKIAFMSSAPQFKKEIAPVYYRRKREDVLTELPDLIESEEWCSLTPNEEKLYESSVLSKNYMKLRRVSWNVDDINESTKAQRLLEIVEDAKNDDRKVIVFSFFLDTIRKICDLLKDRCLDPINGSISPMKRQEIIDEFDKSPAGTVLCAQIQSGGTGLNIQSASVVVICEPQLKPSIENQAISRAYRMGQSRNVQVFRLLSENTIDERLIDLLKEKQKIFDTFADDSLAAKESLVEVDDKSFGDLINQEIERIKQKNNISE